MASSKKPPPLPPKPPTARPPAPAPSRSQPPKAPSAPPRPAPAAARPAPPPPRKPDAPPAKAPPVPQAPRPAALPRPAPAWVKAGPTPRTTIEVDTSWLLEPATAPAAASVEAAREGDAPAKYQPPPMPKRHETMQVQLEWLEESPTSRRRGSKGGMPAVQIRRGPPPIPREEPDDGANVHEAPTRAKGPPPLPPEEIAKRPSRAAMMALKKGPPPIPREDPDDEPPPNRRR